MGTEKLGNSPVRLQVENPELIPPADVAAHLFPEKEVDVLTILKKLKTRPLEGSELLILRPSEYFPDQKIRACLLGGKGDLATALTSSESYQKIAEKIKKGRIKGVVIFIGEENFSDLEEVETGIDLLAEQNQFWVLEETVGSRKLAKEEEQLRKENLRAMGLVKPEVKVVEGESFVSWYARKKKERIATPVNLLEKFYHRQTLAEMRERYLLEGWKSVDTAELEERCRHSLFYLSDTNDLAEGNWTTLEAPCGCQWHTSRKGWQRIRLCPEEECDGYPTEEARKEAQKRLGIPIGRDIPTEKRCWRCEEEGNPVFLVMDRVIESRDKDEIKTIVNIRCPHHGLCGRDKRETIPTYKVYSFEQDPKKPHS